MRKNSYQETISKIKATDSFKANTIMKMQNELKKDKQEDVPQKHKYRYKSIGVVAACCAVVLSIGILADRQLNPVNENKIPDPIASNNEQVNLPKLTISNESGGMGYEGYMAYKIEELEDGNPWTPDSKLTSMPVFENLSPHSDHTGTIPYLNGDEMIQKAKEAAGKMSLKINKVYTQPTKEEIEEDEKKTGEKVDTTPTHATAECDGVKIEVDSRGDTRVRYEPTISIPGKYSFTQYDNTSSEAKDTSLYLIKKYSDIVDMKSPSLRLFGDYTYEGKRLFWYTAYESDGDLLNKILGYNFNTVSFVPDENGKLWIIDRRKTDLSKVIGNYPIITADEARKLLIEKHYITTMPEAFPDEKYIAKVELVYRNSMYDKVFMPYYKFLVEMPTMQQKNSLKTFGTFYVPAVKGEYLTNMPAWNGEFN
ncbi:MAG: hypothetical protein ABRQ25_17790 [Clostridiaceae bacterium]